MTCMAANKYQLYFDNCPDFWRFTPCDGKVPINPDTGSAKGNEDWPSRPYTLDQIIDKVDKDYTAEFERFGKKYIWDKK